MKCVINNEGVLSRPPEGPLAGHIVSFAQSLRDQGYSLWAMKDEVLIAAGFDRWLKQKGIGVHRIGSEHPALYLRYRYRHQRPNREDFAAFSHFIDFLGCEEVILGEKRSVRRLVPVERCALTYEQ